MIRHWTRTGRQGGNDPSRVDGHISTPVNDRFGVLGAGDIDTGLNHSGIGLTCHPRHPGWHPPEICASASQTERDAFTPCVSRTRLPGAATRGEAWNREPRPNRISVTIMNGKFGSIASDFQIARPGLDVGGPEGHRFRDLRDHFAVAGLTFPETEFQTDFVVPATTQAEGF